MKKSPITQLFMVGNSGRWGVNLEASLVRQLKTTFYGLLVKGSGNRGCALVARAGTRWAPRWMTPLVCTKSPRNRARMATVKRGFKPKSVPRDNIGTLGERIAPPRTLNPSLFGWKPEWGKGFEAAHLLPCSTP